MIARWKPVHLGHSVVLRALCESAQHVIVGIGSSNRYNLRNPFTVDETKAMLAIALRDYDNYEIVEVPDLDDGPRWRVMVRDMFGELDAFISDNDYVSGLLQEFYAVIKPVTLVAEEDKVPLNATMVRFAMAAGEPWHTMVAPEIADYLIENNLDRRFRREFGMETLKAALNKRK